MYVATALALRAGDRERLEALTRRADSLGGVAQRALIVLLAADGLGNTEVARLAGASRPTVLKWRRRYQAHGLAGLTDEPRPGRPTGINEVDVVAETLADNGVPPAHLGTQSWSARLMADRLGISFASVARIWRKYDLRPQHLESFRFATEPTLEARMRRVLGLHLSQQVNAVVVSMEETREGDPPRDARPSPPPHRGTPEQQSANLIAGLAACVDTVGRQHDPRHTIGDFVEFLDRLCTGHPGTRLHVVCDNHATAEHPQLRAWRDGDRELSMYGAPTTQSWLKMVAIFFGIAIRQGVRRGADGCLGELDDAIRAHNDAFTESASPFTWIKSACPSHLSGQT